MSIKGFSIGGVTQKYDYNALDNIPRGEGLSEEAKQAILQIAEKVAYIDAQGQTYYDALHDAFYPPKTVVLITAVFEQGSTVIYDDTALDSLKQYLQVTAKYDDNTTSILPDSAYTLSGLLEAPSSTVTVLYSGMSTTFSVTVTARPTLSSISAAYTQSGTVYDTDTLDSLKADLVVTAVYSDSSTQTVPAADYTLSGELTAGTSTVTVSYGGKTTPFSVTVSTTKLYQVYNKVVAPDSQGISYFDTGVDLLSSDRDFTIAVDLDMQQSLRQAGCLEMWTLLACVMPDDPWSGITIKRNKSTNNVERMTTMWMTNYFDNTTLSRFAAFNYDFTGRARFVLAHESGSGALSVYGKFNDNAVVSGTITATYSAAQRNELRFAGTTTGSQNFAATFTSCIVDGVTWDSNRIDAFLA